jgi:hypothetical protein
MLKILDNLLRSVELTLIVVPTLVIALVIQARRCESSHHFSRRIKHLSTGIFLVQLLDKGRNRSGYYRASDLIA